jgi:hypothetical protein
VRGSYRSGRAEPSSIGRPLALSARPPTSKFQIRLIDNRDAKSGKQGCAGLYGLGRFYQKVPIWNFDIGASVMLLEMSRLDPPGLLSWPSQSLRRLAENRKVQSKRESEKMKMK